MNIKSLILGLTTVAAMAAATTLYAATQDIADEVKVEAEPKEQTVAANKEIDKAAETESKVAETPKDVTTDESADNIADESVKEAADKTIKPAKKTDRFIPTESISEDLAVSFPVDI